MKKYFIFLFTLSFTIMTSFAQIQQGYVKTKGRLASNGTVISGIRLSGVTVHVKGRSAVLSQSNGTFSFPIPELYFHLQSVQKQGYVMTDPDMLSRQYTYSNNPLILVLETKEQHADDKLAAEKKIRRTLQRQLQDKENEIESLKEQQKLSEEEYRKQLQEMYAQQESNEKLIGEMAERYSKMDFDEVDEFNRHISQLILDGKLTEADSLLNTKGDINTRAAMLRQHQEANAQAELELKKKQKRLEKNKEFAKKELEDLAQDCYSKFEIFKMKHQNDSAFYYLELRTGLDSTNIFWQIGLGQYVADYLSDYDKALSYYQFALLLAKEKEDDNGYWTSVVYTNMGSVYSEKGEYSKAVEYNKKALSIVEKLSMIDSLDLAREYNNLGTSLGFMGNYSEALEYHNKAISIQQQYGINNDEIAASYNNIALVLEDIGDYNNALSNYTKALCIYETIYPEPHPGKARNYNNVGSLYGRIGKYDEALEFHNKALVINRQLYGEKHQDVATNYNNMATIYCNRLQYKESLELYELSLSILMNLYGENILVGIQYNNIGKVYYRMNDYNTAYTYYIKSKIILQQCLNPEHPNLAILYYNIGETLAELKDYDLSISYLNKSLAIFNTCIPNTHPNYVKVAEKLKEVKGLKGTGYSNTKPHKNDGRTT